MNTIECRELSKVLDNRAVVDHLSFTVAAGEVFGFLGRNGAGKSTTIRMLLGLVKPTSGEAYVLGQPIPPSADVLADIGAMIEHQSAYGWMSGYEYLRVLSSVGKPVSRGRIGQVLEQTGLAGAGKRAVRKYSLGMRQRLGLAAALLRRPRLLILDEPANGLDPQGILDFRELICQLSQGGTSVFLSSHQLGEIERTCDRVAIIDNGRLVEIGTPAQVGTSTGINESVRVSLTPADLEDALQALSSLQVKTVADGELIVVESTGKQVIAVLTHSGITPESVTSEHNSLEERFLSVTEET